MTAHPSSSRVRVRTGVRLQFVAIAAVLAVVMSACADFAAPSDPASGLPDVEIANPSFSTDVQPILTKRCSIGGCHSFGTHQAGLTLAAGVSYDALVGVRSTRAPDLLRVSPGFACGEGANPVCLAGADSSYLVRVLVSDPARRRGLPRMPLESLPLTTNQIATIANWIRNGAPRN